MELWCQKVGSTPRLLWHVRPNWLFTNSRATDKGFTRNPSLKLPVGAHACGGACKNLAILGLR
eukprot:1154197-Pelagomonas_calceolata.AAC.9